MKEKISVVIPTYNREKIIMKSLNSVLEQTYDNLEVIVVDDASTDNTEEVIKNINDDRIVYIKLEKNQGASHARNVGIENATGKYLAFQDSDDYFLKEKLEKQYENLKKKKSDIDFCKIVIFDKENKAYFPNDEQLVLINKNRIIDELCNGNFISTQAILMKTKIAKNILFDEELPRLQDYDYVLRLTKGNKVSYTDEILVELYRQDDSISNNLSKLERALEILAKKDYGFTEEQQNSFNRYIHINRLVNIISHNNDTINQLTNNINDLNKEKENLVIGVNNLKKEKKESDNAYKEMAEEFNNLNEEKQKIDEEYNKIINSKRWKILNRIISIFNK